MIIYKNTKLSDTRINILILILLGIVCIHNSLEAQTPTSDDPFLFNPSFEGWDQEYKLPPYWIACGSSTPNRQPNEVEVHLAPSDGETYISMRVRGLNFNSRENVYTRLKQPLEQGKCYTMSVDLAHDDTVIFLGNPTPSYPTVFRVWGSNGCDTIELLAVSPVIENSDWETYNLILSPEEDTYDYLFLEPYYAADTIYHGLLLIDNIRFLPETDQRTIVMDTLVWPGTEITFTPSESNIYQWDPVPGLDCYNCPNPTVIADHNQTYIVNLEEENECPFTEFFIINILSCDMIYPESYIVKLDTTIKDIATLKLQASEGYEYSWSSANMLSCNDCSDPEVIIERAVTVTCTLIDEHDCSFHEVFTINMEFSYPNVITPNGDGKNEVFIVKGLPENTQLLVFNRSGVLVYETHNYQNNWRGRDRQGNLLPQDTYWIVISEPTMNIYVKDYLLIKR